MRTLIVDSVIAAATRVQVHRRRDGMDKKAKNPKKPKQIKPKPAK